MWSARLWRELLGNNDLSEIGGLLRCDVLLGMGGAADVGGCDGMLVSGRRVSSEMASVARSMIGGGVLSEMSTTGCEEGGVGSTRR